MFEDRKATLISRATDGDVGALAGIVEGAYRHIYAERLDGDVLNGSPRKRVIESTLRAQYYTTHIARYGEKVLGFVTFAPEVVPSIGYVKAVTELSILAVEEQYRRQGVGRVLFESVIAELRSRPLVRHLVLWVASDNGVAREFYEKVGMVVVREREVAENRMLKAGASSYKEVRYQYDLYRGY